MKFTILPIFLFFFCSACESDTIYNTLGKQKRGEFWSINFPILQKFSVTNASVIDNITVGIPMQETPGRQLSVLLYTNNRDLIATYTTPSDYYYNVDHYYSFATDKSLLSGDYFFGVKMSNGPTGWVMTSGGMLGRIDAYCVPETKYISLLLSPLAGIAIVLHKLKAKKRLKNFNRISVDVTP